MEHIGKVLSRSIKESKWVAISYLNTAEQKTFFWCSIQDIDIENKTLFVHAFNQTKIDDTSDGVIESRISFDRIQSAFIVEGTKYDVPILLLDKIEKEKDRLKWLEFDLYDERMLAYFRDCIIYDQPPYQRESVLVYGVDQDVLSKEGTYKLNYQQLGLLADQLEKISSSMDRHDLTMIELIINDLSIFTPKGKFVVAYKRVNFNPYTKSLIMDEEIQFNYSFIMEEKDVNIHNLKNYLDIDVEKFTDLYLLEKESAKTLLQENLRYDEKLDDLPY